MCGVRGVVKAVSSLPLVDARFTNAKALRKSSCAVGAYRNLGSYGRRGACVFVQGDHHDKAPGWTAEVMHRLSINCRMTSLAMNSGYRFESMQSSGMRHLGLLIRGPTQTYKVNKNVGQGATKGSVALVGSLVVPPA